MFANFFKRKISTEFTATVSNYSWATKYMENHPSRNDLIVEVGSRDALDAIQLQKKFGCQVVAFEPEPSNFNTCVENLAKSDEKVRSNITILQKCLLDLSKEIEFRNVLTNIYNNPGASSVFEIDFQNRSKSDPDFNRQPVQGFIKVQAYRFDTLGFESPHSLFMDIQGAELLALIGFGDLIKSVTNIVLETCFESTYVGGCNFKEINQFLEKNGFTYVASDSFGKTFPLKLPVRKRSGEFNVLYSRKF